MSDIDRKLQIVSMGKMAEVAWQHFSDDLEAQRKSVEDRLKAEYRTGKNDLGTLAGGVAALCALDDLKDRVMKKIKRSMEINKETLNGSPK